MDKITKFVPITKVDKEKRMVYGWASTEDLDSDGEIIKASALEKALPDYMKFPTIREMHQPKAAGKTVSAEVRKNENGIKGLYIAAKIVTDEAWNLVKEGVYGAFSVGGNVIQKAGNIINDMQLVEISLVDVPANPSAVIEVWKSGDGARPRKINFKGLVASNTSNTQDNLQKDASGVYRYVQLLSDIQWCMSCCDDPKDPDYKKLAKMLEQVKAMISMEALEPEQSPTELMASNNPQDIHKFINSLKRLEFKDNSIAETIRKGVIVAMDKKAKELKEAAEKLKVQKAEEATEEVEESTEEAEKAIEEKGTQGESVETESQETESETKDEAEVSEESEETAESDKGLDASMQKMNDVNKRLSEITPTKEVEKLNVEKKLDVMADTIVKLTDLVVDINKRMSEVMKAAAPTKSKASFVTKGKEETEDKLDLNAFEKSIAEKKARLQELTKIREEIGANNFAKGGYSTEAGKLQAELEQLNSKAR